MEPLHINNSLKGEKAQIASVSRLWLSDLVQIPHPDTPILTVASCCIVGISDRLDLLLYDWIILHTTGHFQLPKPTITPPQHDFRKATWLTYNYSVGNVVLANKKLRTYFQKDSRQRWCFPFIADIFFSKCVFLETWDRVTFRSFLPALQLLSVKSRRLCVFNVGGAACFRRQKCLN